VILNQKADPSVEHETVRVVYISGKEYSMKPVFDPGDKVLLLKVLTDHRRFSFPSTDVIMELAVLLLKGNLRR